MCEKIDWSILTHSWLYSSEVRDHEYERGNKGNFRFISNNLGFYIFLKMKQLWQKVNIKKILMVDYIILPIFYIEHLSWVYLSFYYYFFYEQFIHNCLLYFPLSCLSFPHFLEVICIFWYQFMVIYVHCIVSLSVLYHCLLFLTFLTD